MKRQHLFLACIAIYFAIFPGVVYPQFSVSGKITDKENGNPLSGANIIVQGTRFSTSSSEDGTYRIAGLKPGSYKFNEETLYLFSFK